MTEIQLTYTLRAAQLHSISLAAAQLHVSQPSVSVQITRLEQELGFRIFDRDRKTVFPFKITLLHRYTVGHDLKAKSLIEGGPKGRMRWR